MYLTPEQQRRLMPVTLESIGVIDEILEVGRATDEAKALSAVQKSVKLSMEDQRRVLEEIAHFNEKIKKLDRAILLSCTPDTAYKRHQLGLDLVEAESKKSLLEALLREPEARIGLTDLRPIDYIERGTQGDNLRK